MRMGIKVIERVEAGAVKALCGMALGNEIVVRGPLQPAEKGEGRAVNSEAPVVRRCLQGGKGTVELSEDFFQSLRPKLVPLLVERGERGREGESGWKSKKSSNSLQALEAPWETRKEISISGGIFLRLVKFLSGLTR